MEVNLISLKEFCRAFGVGRTLAYGLIAAGEIDARKCGRRTLITAESARRWAALLPQTGARHVDDRARQGDARGSQDERGA